ncbi:MAG: family 43 glycosylhydrolase [Lachnospiraceae bacterium]|nr:family 43 glycosylhydrolase [Lachnospiraceae bacterium]
MENQCFNPYLPSWEYIPDGEPHIFDGRVYVYGSHDRAGGWVFCLNDYVCWSAAVGDLTNWRYEGVIYKKTNDPLNTGGQMVLYAPDVTKGPDGRYYLYYVLDKANVVSIAVCDYPAGQYEFYGYVRYPDGVRLGERENDEPQFDPGVMTEGNLTYLYTGFCGHGDSSRSGCFATVLFPDMLTIKEEPKIIIPGNCYGEGTSFYQHEYFEAASIRKVNGLYYLIYSSTPMTELCYAVSKYPTHGFTYGGVIVSNCDLHIDTYKKAEKHAYMLGNNHGSICEINNKWYIFYHRMTNGTWFSRQGMMEEIKISGDGAIKQVEMTSMGANGKPLAGFGEYPAYIACNLYHETDGDYFPRITQDGNDGDTDPAYITGITDGCVVGFKYFSFTGLKKITILTRGYNRGTFEVRLTLNGECHGQIPIVSSNIWTEFSTLVTIPDGVNALYLIYRSESKNGASIKALRFD